MRIAVVGANGRTGRLVVEQALARGNEVTALARRPQPSSLENPRLTTVAADVLDRGGVVEGLRGADAVVSAVGIGTSRQESVTYSTGTGNLLHAMGVHGIKRLVVISAVPVGPREDHAFFERHVVMPILDAVFGATYRDMRRMESLLVDSDVDWTSVRPPRLLVRPRTGHYRISTPQPLSNGRAITYGDLAGALLDIVDREDLYRRVAYVAN